MKRLLAFMAVAILGTAAFADYADIHNELQRRAMDAECQIAHRLGSLVKTFEITPYPITVSMVSNITAQAYTGSPITPMPSVVFNGSLLSTNTDYSVSWEDNVATNTHAKCIVSGKGNFGGVAVKEFTI